MRQKHIKRIIYGVILLLLPLIYFLAIKSLPFIERINGNINLLSANNIPKVTLKNDILIKENISDVEPNIIEKKEIETFAVTNEEIINIPINKARPANAGIIKHQTYKEGVTGVYIPLANGYIKNCTSQPAKKIAETVKKLPKMKIKADSKPTVLIMHTHTTESYQQERTDWFSRDYNCRTTDENKNMISVGNEIEKGLVAAGIGVIHNKTMHDYPSYNGAYERSAVTVKKILKENPSIKIVLDIHRDAIQPNADTMISPVTKINGKDCAQVMIISGCDNGKMNMPNYFENLKFAALLQNQMEADYKTLTRPILFDYRKYNQDLTTGSILIEVGGHANTHDEAIYAGELIGKSLAKALEKLK